MKPISDPNYFRFQRFINWFARAFFFEFRVQGLENLPPAGPLLITTNHLSVYDAPVVFMTVPYRTRMFGADKWRATPGMAQLCESVGVIWVTRGEADTDAIKEALGWLKGGGCLGIAPEGTRSPTKQLLPGKTGAAFLATRTNCPVIPFAMTGTELVADGLKRRRKALVTLTIGKPYHLPAGRAKHDDLERYTDIIMCRLAALLPPDYRGVYAQHPLLPEMERELA